MTQLKARAVSRRITPKHLPVRLGGNASDHPADSVADELEVNCLFLKDSSSAIVIVSLDLLYVTERLRSAVLNGLEDTGLMAENVFIAASHTHYAPAIDETKTLLGMPDAGYLQDAVGQVVEAVRDAVLGPTTAARLAVGSGSASIGVNRRRKRPLRVFKDHIEINQVGMGPNPAGPTDPRVSVVEVRTDSGAPLAYLWSAACHPTARGLARIVSADWPGAVRAEMRRRCGRTSTTADGLPVLFLQGFSGDVRPPSGRRAKLTTRGLLLRAMMGRGFYPMRDAEYASWSGDASDSVANLTLDCAPIATELELSTARLELPAGRFAEGAEGLPPVSFHRVSIGPVTIVGASAELVSGYASQVRALAPDQHVIPVGCIDHVIGYWPLQHMFGEGGYEVAHHCPSFSIEACVPDIESIVMEQFSRLFGRNAADAEPPSDRP